MTLENIVNADVKGEEEKAAAEALAQGTENAPVKGEKMIPKERCHRRVRSLQKWRFKSLQSDIADKEVRSGGYESPQLTGLASGDAVFV